MYESELGKLNTKRDREMFTNIYKSKSIRLEFYIKALENKILSFKTQMHHLCFLLLECSKDSINENSIEVNKFNENSNINNNNSSDTISDDTAKAESTKNSQNSTNWARSLYNFLLYFWIQIVFYLKHPFKGLSDEWFKYFIRQELQVLKQLLIIRSKSYIF